MVPDTFRELVDFDNNVKIGDAVQARWMNNNDKYRSTAKVTKLGTYSVQAEIDDDIKDGRGKTIYPKGTKVNLPRMMQLASGGSATKWTFENGLFPDQFRVQESVQRELEQVVESIRRTPSLGLFEEFYWS